MSEVATAMRALDLFDGVEDAALEEFGARGTERAVGAGEDVVRHGDMPTFVLVLEGVLQSVVEVAGVERTGGDRHLAPTYAGAALVMALQPWAVSMRALEPSRVLDFSAEDFRAFARSQPTVEDAALRLVFPIARRVAATAQQQEKLAALGTMAAGLAHELNNPAAAAQRSAQELGRAIDVMHATIEAFVSSGVERADAAGLVELKNAAAARALREPPLGALEAADLEDELTDRIEPIVAEPWGIVDALVAARVDAGWVDEVERLAGPATQAALRWVAATIAATGLVDELRDSTERISTLVTAIKEYTYMDQGTVQEVDVHDGLESTLTILGHKLRASSITVEREYDRDLPRLEVHGSELNQVWTNLIDNAIDALDGEGVLTLRTARDGDRAQVDVVDTGTGIPEAIRARVFDPFFTTKDPGRGTGLGLETARRIVTERHHGELRLEPGPGGRGTRASVRLPLPA
ncbi:MAG TPA: ATP-binding protein [Solirubrobacteraceae bacterium]